MPFPGYLRFCLAADVAAPPAVIAHPQTAITGHLSGFTVAGDFALSLVIVHGTGVNTLLLVVEFQRSNNRV